MKEPIFKGSGVAIVTPFTENGVNYDLLSELCEWHIQKHTDAIVVAGTTGEASTMPDDEHLSVIGHVVKQVRGRVPVIAGTGSNDTRHAIELSQRAEELKADGLLHVTPYYNKATQEGLYRHYTAIAESVNIPIIVYNVPSRTSMNINAETLARLSECPQINGVKECNIEQAGQVAYCCGDNLNLYSGEDAMVMPLLSFGGIGVISVVANIVPDRMHELVTSFLEGNTQRAIELQVKLVPLIKAMFCEVNPIPIKAALNLMGFSVGTGRMPLCEPSEASLDLISKTLSDYNLI
jgi:4-hydroxy-tetrahydrodipicolinate synthase